MKLLLMSTWLLLGAAAHGQTRPTAAAQAQSVAGFQQRLNQEFSSPAESPLPAAERVAFRGLPFYPVAYDYCVVARLQRDSTALPFAMPVSSGVPRQYRKYGTLYFTLQGQFLHLTVYQSLALLARPGFADYLFVPFTDDTNGHGSYHGGRYLDLRLPPPGISGVVLDFNLAYNPSCAYSAGYACPVPPPENHLPLAVPAGVQLSH